MAIILCSKGHYYDENKFFQCPYCGINFMTHIKDEINENKKYVSVKAMKEKSKLLEEDTDRTLLLTEVNEGISELTEKSTDRALLLTEINEGKSELTEKVVDKTLLLTEVNEGISELIEEDTDRTVVLAEREDDKTLLLTDDIDETQNLGGEMYKDNVEKDNSRFKLKKFFLGRRR